MKTFKALMLTTSAAAFTLIASTASAVFINNGDFQAGDTGFTTQYSPTLGIGYTEGTYTICDNPYGLPPERNPLATSYYDHTYGTASGRMMAVNGSPLPNQLVWGQIVTGLQVGQQYEFSLWVSSWYAQSQAHLDIQINGASQITFYTPTTTGLWSRRSFAWTATSASAVLGAIYDMNTDVIGNDFALDDISLVEFSGQHQDETGFNSPVPEPSTYLAGALLLLPFGASALRSLRKQRLA